MGILTKLRLQMCNFSKHIRNTFLLKYVPCSRACVPWAVTVHVDLHHESRSKCRRSCMHARCGTLWGLALRNKYCSVLQAPENWMLKRGWSHAVWCRAALIRKCRSTKAMKKILRDVYFVAAAGGRAGQKYTKFVSLLLIAAEWGAKACAELPVSGKGWEFKEQRELW